MTTALREKLLALSDEDIGRLILVGGYAINNCDTATMIAEELGIETDALTTFGKAVVLPLIPDANIALDGYDATSSPGM